MASVTWRALPRLPNRQPPHTRGAVNVAPWPYHPFERGEGRMATSLGNAFTKILDEYASEWTTRPNKAASLGPATP